MFDPYITPNELASGVDIDSIACDYVFISHGHEDHVADAAYIIKRNNAMLVSNYEVVTWFQKKGIERVHPMNLGGSKAFDFGCVKYVYAMHSSMLPDGSYGGNPGGWIIESDHKVVYYAGDTALNSEMKLIGERFKIDWAILPLGDNFTMGPLDAERASDILNCHNVIGMHYDTFEYIKIDHDKVKDVFAKTRKKLSLMAIGETKEL